MKYLIIAMLLSCTSLSCKKYLDIKPDKKLVVPSGLSDLQALLDLNNRMNLNNPAIGEISADNYFLKTADWLSFAAHDRNAYVWDTAIYNSLPNDWSTTYDVVYYANLALESLETTPRTPANAAAWDNIKGSALLFRGKSFLQAAWIWAPAWDNTSLSAPGIPLRLSSDFNEPSKRATVQQTYDRVLEDLKAAVPLLPALPQHVMRPSKAAAYAFLSRTFLCMRQYAEAGRYADSALQLYNTLLDYNTANASASFPFPRFNSEIIFFSRMPNLHLNLHNAYARIDTALYTSYAGNDLRKALFFKSNGDGTYSFKGSYDGSANLFNGIATGELYLVRAEAFARQGMIGAAMDDLNTLLAKRWKTGTFIPLTAATAQEALDLVLAERRKELIFRDLRWMDIKRLNRERAEISLKRAVNNALYTLPPNDNRYALPLPEDIINLTGMPQNPR